MPGRVKGAGRPRGRGKEETEERRGPVGLKFIKMHGLGNDYLYVLGNPDRARERYGLVLPSFRSACPTGTSAWGLTA